MQALILHAKHQVRIERIPEPSPQKGCVKIAVAYCGICGTDFHKFEGLSGSRPLILPVPLGHEISGIVAEIGEGVTAFAPGDRVTVDPNWSCGLCHNCQSGKRHLCTASRGVVKGMVEYICPPVEQVYRLPDELSLRDAALAEPLSCCLRGMDQLDCKLGDTVAIVGCGAIGAIMLALCRRAGGGEIVVLDADEGKRDYALSHGASLFINPAREHAAAVLTQKGIVPTRIIECAGNPSAVETALDIAGRGATVVLFGVNRPEAEVKLRLYDLFARELTIRTSYINPHTTARAIALLASGALDIDALISAEITLDMVADELATRALSRHGKVLVRIGSER